MTLELLFERLTERLKGLLPGLMAQLQMVPDPRPGDKTYREVEDSCLKAGVLLLLYHRGGLPHLVLTRRTEQVLHHRAQISLPGGRIEPGESRSQAALRETKEELGISLENIRLLGELTPLYVPPSNYCIYPVVAAAADAPDFSPHPEEVAEIIEVPLGHLLDTRNTVRETWLIRGEPVVVPYYSYKEYKIWGATAMILAEFLDLVKIIWCRVPIPGT